MVSPTQLCWRYHSLPLRHHLIQCITYISMILRWKYRHFFIVILIESAVENCILKMSHFWQWLLIWRKVWHFVTPNDLQIFWHHRQFDSLVQDCSNSIANALELLQSCTKPSSSSSHIEVCSRALGCHWWQMMARHLYIVITSSNADLLSFWPSWTNYSGTWLKIQKVSSRKCIWKCCLKILAIFIRPQCVKWNLWQNIFWWMVLTTVASLGNVGLYWKYWTHWDWN